MKTVLRTSYAAILVSLVIFMHELGHAYAASLFGVPVESMGIGLSLPPYTQFIVNGVPVTISIWLIGGYVRIDPALVGSLPFLPQIAIYGAGLFVNLLFGLLIPEFRNRIAPTSESHLLGPLGSFKYVNKAFSEQGFLIGTFILLKAINMGCFYLNILPIPPLDGGKIVQAIPIAIFGYETVRPYLPGINLIGLIILLFLLVRSISKE